MDTTSEQNNSQAETAGQSATVSGLHRNDGSLVINLDEKALEARADFMPPLGDGQPLTPDYIASALDRLNIVHGVDWDVIRNAALECNLNRQPARSVVIARGDPPVEEILEYYELDPSFRSWPNLPDADAIRVDYRELSPFVVVKKDQVLALFHPRKSGRPGKDVRGAEIPMPVRRPESAEPGQNTRRREDAIVAARDGRLVENGKELMVEEVLAVKGTVGYKTGHIVFPGDVIIDGSVADGFKVYSGGSIIAKQTFDATDVIAKKDMLIAGGVIGRGRASIKAGGGFKAKFVQNCRLAARGSVSISAAAVNSTIYTLDKLDLGDKGRIVGCEVYAVHGVRAAGIGTEGGKSTKLHCGVDFTAQQELDRVNEQVRTASLKAAKVRELIAAPSTDGLLRTKYEDYLKRLSEEQNRLNARITDLLGRINADEDAAVEISGDAAKGTTIEICHISLVLDKTLKKVRFRLDKTQGKLVHESLK